MNNTILINTDINNLIKNSSKIIEVNVQKEENFLIRSNLRLKDMILVMDTEYKTMDEFLERVKEVYNSNYEKSIDFTMHSYCRLDSLSEELKQAVREEIKSKHNIKG